MKMSLKYQTRCPLLLLSFHCCCSFISPVSFPSFRIFFSFPLPPLTELRGFSSGFASCHFSSHGLHNTFLLCCVFKPQTKVILILTIQLNLALLKVFSLSQMEVGHFDLLARQSAANDIKNCHSAATSEEKKRKRIWNYE